MGLLKERGLVESVQEMAGNKNHGRVLGRCFCGGGHFHSRRVMRPVEIRMAVLVVAVPWPWPRARGFCGEVQQPGPREMPHMRSGWASPA